MKLVIVESPGKCKKIQAILGDGWNVQASVGHIRDLPRKELGVDLDSLKPHYEETKKDVIRSLKSKAKAATEVWLATDLDREGEAIAWHLQKVLGLTKPKRIVFNEITQDAVRNAVAQPREIDVNRVAAQESRRVIDRLVGYLVSPAICNIANDKLSAGRVQSVVVKLVVERDDAIVAFKPTDHFTVGLQFNDNPEWTATLDTKPYVSEDSPYITDRTFAERVAGVNAAKVIGNETKPSFRKAPAPFITTTLQQAGSIHLNFSSSRTMEIAQKLYEQGFITYHRTDYPNLSNDGREKVYAHLRSLDFGDSIPDKPNVEKVPEGAQEAHEAIRPSDFTKSTDGLDKDCLALYQMILDRTLASQMRAAEYSKTTIVLEGFGVEIDGQPPIFRATGSRLVHPGWKVITASDQTSEEGESDDSQVLPKVDFGAVLVNFKALIKDQKTKPPAKFTEASIIKTLEKMQIGRPATYASIIKNITDRGYVQIEKRKFTAMEKGRLVVDLLKGFNFMDYAFTKDMEALLDHVAGGSSTYKATVSKMLRVLQEDMVSLEGVTVAVTNPCPKCGSQVNRVKGKFGFFWSCSGFRAGCDFTGQDSKGKMLTEEQAIARREKKAKQTEATEHLCSCGAGSLVRRKAKKKGANGEAQYWYGCNTFPACKLTFFEVEGKPKMETKGGLSTEKGDQQA